MVSIRKWRYSKNFDQMERTRQADAVIHTPVDSRDGDEGLAQAQPGDTACNGVVNKFVAFMWWTDRIVFLSS